MTHPDSLDALLAKIATSFHARTRFVDDPCPLRNFGRDVGSERLRRAADSFVAIVSEPRLEVRRVQALDDLIMETRNNRLGRFRGREDSVPARQLKPRHPGFGHRRQFRRYERAPRAGDCESPDFSSLDLGQRKETLLNSIAASPDINAMRAGPPPLYGTCTRSIPARSFSNSA